MKPSTGWPRVTCLERSFFLQSTFAIFLTAACALYTCGAATFEQVKQDFHPSDTLVLDRHGELLQRVRLDASVRRGQWVALADISPALRTALVLSEDKRFYEHSGVDWRAVSGAAWANLWNTRTRGASTLSMQLAGLLDPELRAGTRGRSITQKIGQTFSAQLLEQRWRKDQILEAYLNLVPFRGELVGIDALSRTLFGKAAHGLDEREAAVAGALVRAPNARPAQVAQRACGVLKLMQPGARIDCVALDLFATGALQRRDFQASEGMAPHAARQLVRAGQARSTLRAPLQRFAVQTLRQHLRELRGRHVEDGAIVVLDNASGEVLAWVGSSGDLSAAAEVDGVLALRQPGSTLKPFLYAQAIAERRITAASLLEDSSAQIPTAGGLYIPQNYDRQFKGLVSGRTALAASLNVPAVRTLVMVSPDAFARQLRAVGLPLAESGDYYGYSLALGSAEVSLLSLANAYRTLANGGRFSVTSLVRQPQPASRPALDARAAFIVTDILADPLARARTFGTDSILATRFWSAVKTGTSKDMRDNWAIGFSQRYTVGVWVGNASGAPMWDVSGTSGAAPVWAALMKHLHQTDPSRAPAPPPGVVQSRVAFGDQLEATRSEWFIQGTEQSLFAIDSGAANAYRTSAKGQKHLKGLNNSSPPRITAPAPGSIIALDPDIAPAHQRLTFSAQGNGLRWRMDGREFARGTDVRWLPWPGRHVVQLLDARGQVVDEIRIEVRGAGVRQAQNSAT
ncbi:penicillin-binding protein 1C [Polaromonas glacialis]|uniref:penicillin-binding protein 1C n=1 Tax=Polaromonas glacialis TaxID=866564 RepID=UPI00068CD549|nr:penicillin-binding protein 1C [Polaromonas glacialis]